MSYFPSTKIQKSDGTVIDPLSEGGDVDVTSSVTSTFDHGRNSDVDAAAEQVTSTSIACKFGVTVKAARSNTGVIYVGNSDVTADSADATDGFELYPGDAVFLPVNNVNLVYVRASVANQAVYWICS